MVFSLFASGGGNFALGARIIAPPPPLHANHLYLQIISSTSTSSKALSSFHLKNADASRMANDEGVLEDTYSWSIDALQDKAVSTNTLQTDRAPQRLSTGQSVAIVTPDRATTSSGISPIVFFFNESFKKIESHLRKLETKTEIRRLSHFSFTANELLGAR